MVVLKKRARPLKLRMIDGTTKTVMVDDSITMVEIVGTSIHLTHAGFWEPTRSGPGSRCDVMRCGRRVFDLVMPPALECDKSIR